VLKAGSSAALVAVVAGRDVDDAVRLLHLGALFTYVTGGAGAAKGGTGGAVPGIDIALGGAHINLFGSHNSLSSTARHSASGLPYHSSAVRQACSECGEAKSFRRLQGPPFDTHMSHRAFCS
jgi:hypothetical protein